MAKGGSGRGSPVAQSKPRTQRQARWNVCATCRQKATRVIVTNQCPVKEAWSYPVDPLGISRGHPRVENNPAASRGMTNGTVTESYLKVAGLAPKLRLTSAKPMSRQMVEAEKPK